MFGLTTKRRAQQAVNLAAQYGASVAESEAVRILKRDLMPAIEEFKGERNKLEHDLASERQRAEGLQLEVDALRRKLANMVELERVSEKDWRIREIEAQVSDLQTQGDANTVALFAPGAPISFADAQDRAQGA